MDVPTFRYMTDAEKFLKEISKSVDESSKLLKKHQQLTASADDAEPPKRKTSTVIDVGPSSRSDQMKLIRKHKHNVDPELDRVVVPGMKKLESQYNLAEDLYDKLKAVEQAETQVKMAFPNRKSPEYDALMTQFATLKEKIQGTLKDCLQFLADVAAKHVPASFQKYIDMVAELVSEHVIFKDSSTFMYVSVDPEGNLVFTAYILLQDVANDEGDVAPHIYISIQWVLGREFSVHVNLNHEYEVPNKLLGEGEEVGSVGEATKAISSLLELENFSSSLGVVPLALQLNVDPTSLKISQFSARDVISKLQVGEDFIEFTFRKELKNPEKIAEVNAQIYKDFKILMKKNGARLSMHPDLKAKPAKVKFTITKVAEGGEFNQYDFEYLRDKFGLNNTQLRKIADLLNSGHSEENVKKMDEDVKDMQKKLQRRYGVDETKMKKINHIINQPKKK